MNEADIADVCIMMYLLTRCMPRRAPASTYAAAAVASLTFIQMKIALC